MAKKQSQKITELRKIPINRLFFVMKHVAEENRWTEYAQALAKVGHTTFIMDLETVDALKHAIRKRVPAKAGKGKKRGKRIEDSATCGSGWGGHPSPPPQPPRPDPPDGGGGGGGGGGGAAEAAAVSPARTHRIRRTAAGVAVARRRRRNPRRGRSGIPRGTRRGQLSARRGSPDAHIPRQTRR